MARALKDLRGRLKNTFKKKKDNCVKINIVSLSPYNEYYNTDGFSEELHFSKVKGGSNLFSMLLFLLPQTCSLSIMLNYHNSCNFVTRMPC